jgi:hypothetical protein
MRQDMDANLIMAAAEGLKTFSEEERDQLYVIYDFDDETIRIHAKETDDTLAEFSF